MGNERKYNAEDLIKLLINNPSKFEDNGLGLELLSEYSMGYSLDTLEMLLQHEDVYVRNVAVFIAAELGNKACKLLDLIIPLLQSPITSIRYFALECIIVCAEGPQVRQVVHVLRSMLDGDFAIRSAALRLFSNADAEQVLGAYKNLQPVDESHRRGLLVLLEEKKIHPEEIMTMIKNDDPLLRKYGAMAAKRVYDIYPELIQIAKESDDPEVRDFAIHFLDIINT